MDIVLASQNKHKMSEFVRILHDWPCQLILPPDNIEYHETGSSFEENALIKAKAVFDQVHKPVLADDSGICVDQLDGAPGIFSARYSGEGATDQMNRDKLIASLEGIPRQHRGAQFVCCLAFINNEGQSHIFQGIIRGEVAFTEQGDQGFGYDSLFIPSGHQQSFAQMDLAQKDQISHRRQALEEFKNYLIFKRR